jgi:hypothetical protein
MWATETSGGEARADGVVVRVDTVNRELTVLFADGLRVVDVPPDCPIRLRGERVRLRMLQARDLVRVTYAAHPDSWVTSAVEVRSGLPPLEPGSRLDGPKSPEMRSADSHLVRPLAGH